MLITNFAAGELSPTLNGRVDLQQYYSGVSHLENFDVIPTGGIERRKGSKRLLKLNGDCRLIPFIVDGSNIFVIAVGPGSAVVYKLNYTAAGVELVFNNNITVGYQNLDEIREVQYAQTYDTLVLVNRKYQPLWCKYANGQLAIATMTPDFYPDAVISDPENQIMLVKAGTAAPAKSVTEDGNLAFTYTDVNGQNKTKTYSNGATGYYLQQGSLYKYPYGGSGWQRNSTDTVDTSLFTSAGNYPGCVTFFNNRLIFASTEQKQQKLWASMAPDTEENRYNKFSTYKKYITVSKVLKDADLHTFTADIDVAQGSELYKFKNMTINVSSLQRDKTYYITSNLWNGGVKAIFEQNALYAVIPDLKYEKTEEGDPIFPIENAVCNISLWKDPSTPTAEDYDYQLAEQNVTTADCSFNFELASEQNDAIKFVSSNRFLSIATESTFWAMAPGCSALDIQVENQGRYGSDNIQGLAIAQATVYFAQGKKGIREFYYDNQSQAFQTNNIAIHAQHLLQESPVVDFDYYNNPYNRLILTRANGTVATLLYDKTNNVMAWNRYTRQSGAVKSCCVTRGFYEQDYIFFVIEDGENYYLEMLGDADKIYIDSWQKYTSFAAAEYSDDAILWNKTQDKTCQVNDIPADFSDETDEVYIGYKYRSYIKSMPCIANDPNGKKRITNLIVRFLDSYMPTLKVTNVPDEHFTTIAQLPYSGVALITYPGQTNRDVYFELEADDIKPVNILAVNAYLA